MFIRFFRSAQPVQIVSFIVLCIVAWVVGWFHPITAKAGMPFYELLGPLLKGEIVNRIIVLLLLLGQAFVVKNIADNYIPSIRNSMVPALVFLLLATSFPDWFTLKPYMIANLLLLFLLRKVQVFYRQENVLKPAFDAGLLVGMMSLFYLPAAVFFILVWIALLTFRPFNWREWMVPIFGLIFPWMLILTLYFVFDSLGDLFLGVIPDSLEGMSLEVAGYMFYPIVLGLTLIPALLAYINKMNTGAVKTNKMLLLIFWLSALVVVAWVVAGRQHGAAYFMCFPLAIMLSNYYLGLKRKWVAELLFLLLLVLQLYERFS